MRCPYCDMELTVNTLRRAAREYGRICGKKGGRGRTKELLERRKLERRRRNNAA